jgi:hypothetical protein
LTTKLYGIICINALNQSGDSTYPTAMPFISWSQNGSTITIKNISGIGIPNNQTNTDSYTFTVLSIGQNIPNNS